MSDTMEVRVDLVRPSPELAGDGRWALVRAPSGAWCFCVPPSHEERARAWVGSTWLVHRDDAARGPVLISPPRLDVRRATRDNSSK